MVRSWHLKKANSIGRGPHHKTFFLRARLWNAHGETPTESHTLIIRAAGASGNWGRMHWEVMTTSCIPAPLNSLAVPWIVLVQGEVLGTQRKNDRKSLKELSRDFCLLWGDWVCNWTLWRFRGAGSTPWACHYSWNPRETTCYSKDHILGSSHWNTPALTKPQTKLPLVQGDPPVI